MLGFEEGDVHVIRNAGGRAADAVRSLVISQRLLGTNEVMVIHHADCGMRASGAAFTIGYTDRGFAYLRARSKPRAVRPTLAGSSARLCRRSLDDDA